MLDTDHESRADKLEFDINTNKLSYTELCLYLLYIISELFIIDRLQVAFGSSLVNNGTASPVIYRAADEKFSRRKIQVIQTGNYRDTHTKIILFIRYFTGDIIGSDGNNNLSRA